MGTRARALVLTTGLVAASLPLAATPAGTPAFASHTAAGAPIFIAGDVTQDVDVFLHDGARMDDFDADYTLADGFAAGDVTGDGVDEVLVAGDVTGDVDVFDTVGRLITSFDGDFTLADGFADGYVLGGPEAEILVAGDVRAREPYIDIA